MPVSPGIYVREFDFSQYTVQLGVTNPVIVGGATKGPVGVPITVQTPGDLVNAFGKPLLTDYGLQCAVRYLNNGGANLTYLRVANAPVSATALVQGSLVGTPPAFSTGTITFNGAVPADNSTITINQTQARAQIRSVNVNTAVSCAASNTASIAVSSITPMLGVYGSTTLVMKTLPTAGNTLNIQGTIFTFIAGASNVHDVHIGATTYETLANLITQWLLDTSLTASVATVSNTTVTATFEFTTDGAYTVPNIPVAVPVGATVSSVMTTFISQIVNNAPTLSLNVVSATVGGFPQAQLTNTMVGTIGNGTLYTAGGSNAVLVGLSGGVDQVITGTGTIFTVSAITPGSWGNGVQVVFNQTQQTGLTTADPVNDPITDRFDMSVYTLVEDGSQYSLTETFKNLSMSSASPRYIVTVITHGVTGETGPSLNVAVSVNAAGVLNLGTSTVSYNLGTSPGAAGTDGIVGLSDASYIGTINGQTATGLQALRNPETSEFNLLAIPGNTSINVINAVISLAISRGDFDYILDPPFGLSTQVSDPNNIVRWHNGDATAIPNAPTLPINNSHVFLYYPWVYVYDSYNSVNIWLPPCGDVLAAMALSDKSVGVGWAVAGPVRGLLNVNNIEYSCSQADRDYLEGIDTTNRVNPIITQAGGGAAIWGNRTCSRANTALNNVSTRRALTYIEKVCATASSTLLFNPNDSTTWTKFTNLVTPPLQNMVQSRAFGSIKVICNASNNPPALRQQKTLRGQILIEAVDAAEIMLLDFGLFSTGATFNENF